MRLSVFFMPVLKENPSEAQIISHRLMLRAGMIRQSTAGIYVWLPLGLRVLKKVERIVREEQDSAGAQEMLMPTVQPADLWKESGRYHEYGPEMLRFRDRHERELLYGPTNEEMITDLFRQAVRSYRDLPKNLYQIQWKFRDEIRPRFGVMRGREFLMKDNYSFDLDYEGAKRSYDNMLCAYHKTFARMGLTSVPVLADPGVIGGTLSQEFHILADTGESTIYYDAALDELREEGRDVDLESVRGLYAAVEEKHDPDSCPVPPDRLRTARGIEVGHIFYFGTKYSRALGAVVSGPDGEPITVEMGSYGIGISRLVGAIIEANHDDAGILWQPSVAPFDVGIVNVRSGDERTETLCEDLYRRLREAGLEVLYDDRDERPGAKFATMDLIGLPWQVIVGPRGVERGEIEVKQRRTGEREVLSAESVLTRLLS